MFFMAKESKHNNLWVLKHQRPDGSVIETRNEDRAEAQAELKKLLLTEFTELMIHRDPLPKGYTGDLLSDQVYIKFPLSAVLKIAIYDRMISNGISRMRLAEMLDCKDHQVDQLLDLQHWTRCTWIDRAMETLGLEIS